MSACPSAPLSSVSSCHHVIKMTTVQSRTSLMPYRGWRGGSAIAPEGVLHTQIRALRPGSVPCDYYSWPPRANELNEEENPPGICSERQKDGLDKQISVCESKRGERRRKACDTKTRRRRCNEIKARSVK